MDNKSEMIMQLKRYGVCDEKVLKAMSFVPRELFVPKIAREQAYTDHPLPIGYGQTISQPYMVALMTEIAQLNPNSRVLEIGTGCGYQAAILSKLCNKVYTIEVIKELAEKAMERLKNLDIENVYIRSGNGYEGWPEYAPFDAIIVTAAPKEVPKPLIEQLKVGGRLIIPVGELPQKLMKIIRTKDGTMQEVITEVKFVPMVND